MNTPYKSQIIRHKIEELDHVAAICHQLRFNGDDNNGAAGILDELGKLLDADSAVFRIYSHINDCTCLASLVSRGVPVGVTDSYMEHFKNLDPAAALLRNASLSQTSMAYGLAGKNDSAVFHKENFIRYRDEFLIPNHLYHHIGFVLTNTSDRYLLFNFHRRETAVAFGPLEQARARLIMEILQGRLGPRLSDGVDTLSTSGLVNNLSIRERDVVRSLAGGRSNKQIACELGISVRTVENHLRTIYRKLGVISRTQLVALLNS